MTRNPQPSILFIGGGNMASAIIAGLRRRDPAQALVVIEPIAESAARLAAAHGVTTWPDAAAACAAGLQGLDMIVLAVKPQQARVALEAASDLLQNNPSATLLSIAAGLRVDSLRAWSTVAAGPATRPIVRAMPNTPALIGAGITGLYAAADTTSAQRSAAESLATATGRVVWLEQESLLDAVTAVSGSGPAYAFLLIEAMTDAGIRLGLPAATAGLLALETVRGASLLAAGSDESPAVLRQRVTSPGGTTAAAIATFEAGDLRGLVDRAITAACRRSEALSAPGS